MGIESRRNEGCEWCEESRSEEGRIARNEERGSEKCGKVEVGEVRE